MRYRDQIDWVFVRRLGRFTFQTAFWIGVFLVVATNYDDSMRMWR